MSIDLITELAAGVGERVVPALSDYDDVSDVWIEAEHRVPPMSCGATVGFWEGQPGAVRLDPWPYDELAVMLTGRVALVDDSGARREFAAGQAFLVPQEFSGVWETIEPSTKIFVAFPPREGSQR
jgi:uncharacterized cupin superfamily protein